MSEELFEESAPDICLFDNAPDMMAVLAIGGKFIHCNQECTNILGYTKDEFLSMESCYDIFTPNSVKKAIRAREEILQGKSYKNLEIQLIKKDKTKLDVLCNLSSIEDKKNNCLRTFAIWRESTELVQARRKLEQHNESLSLFVHAISHDLSAPLRGISFLSRLIHEELGGEIKQSSPKMWQSFFNRIERLTLYFQDLQTYLIADKFSIEEKVDTQVMVKGILDLLVKPKGFRVFVSSDMPVFNTLRIHLQQVLYNLITNAITHNPNPKHGMINIMVQEVDSLLYFSITDNGPGLSSSAIEKISQHLTSNLEVKELGMGLSIVNRILDQVGGSLYICPGDGHSNNFTFTWPKKIDVNSFRRTA
ncbi:PAS domain-containing sensor histidine kinase [Candidatus Paracaedibacter symbiosus]|uniref:PAS domain-containing sensor histidine kinase n=1 Tax=Candidatus Paracaedibacter symbiosus TaxID=244582 RepID=UPI0005098AAF|nr:PAS domain-containing sensor histidine kinase [Candidatus Paracaedibacter symbiosus]